MDALQTALTTAFSDGATSAMTTIGNIVPVAMPVGIGIVVIRVGWRVFKMLTGK